MTRVIIKQGDGGPPRQRELAEGPAGAEHPADPHPHTLIEVDVQALDVPGRTLQLGYVPALIEFGDSQTVLRELARWHAEHFGGETR